MKSLIQEGNTVNIFGGKRNDHIHQYEPEGMTPLHYAAKRGHDNITRLLIDSGADIDFSDGFGRTPLHYAAYPYSSQKKRNDVESARMLIEAGANINAVDQDNKTCFRFAVSSIIRALLPDNSSRLRPIRSATRTPTIRPI